MGDIGPLLFLVRQIRSWRPHVLHTHAAKAGTLGRVAAVLAGRRRPPVVTHTLHGLELTQLGDAARFGSATSNRYDYGGLLPAFVVSGACAAAGAEPEIKFAPGRQCSFAAVDAVVAALAAVPVYLSTTLTARAETQSATSMPRALQALSLATRINLWAVRLLIVRSAILIDDRRRSAAVGAARQATRRGPTLWTAWAALADAQRAAGNRTAAAAALRRALKLNSMASRGLAGR